MRQFKLKSLLLTTILLNSITVSSGTREEVEAFERVVAIQSAEIQIHRGIATDVFTRFNVPPPELKAAADSIVLDATGLSYCNQLKRSTIKDIPSPASPKGYIIKTDEKYEAPVRIFIELLAHLGIHEHARTWNLIDTLSTPSLRATRPWLPHDDSMPIVDWVLAQTQTIMEALGEHARIIPRITIRGGVDLATDYGKAREIQSSLRPRGGDRLTDNSMRSFLENPLMYKWFIKLGSDMEKRARFMAVCFDMIAANLPLTEDNLEENYRFIRTIAR